MKMFNSKLRKKIKAQEDLIKQQADTINMLDNFNNKLIKEISKRDQLISDQQRRMRFFGIEIGNEEYHPDPVDFPSVIKL